MAKGGQSKWWQKALGAALLAGVAGLSAAPSALAADPPRPAAAQPAVEVIFTGFARRADKGASIFVRMTREVPVAVDRAGRRITYRLAGAKLGVPNSGNPLPTEHFGPPVSHVALVPSTEGLSLVIDLSSDPGENAPTHRLATSAGLTTLLVELPPPARAD